MSVLHLFVAALSPVLEVLLITCLGSFLATKRVNVLNPEATNHLNNIGFYVFYPSLIVSSIAKTITYESMAVLWFMPINILITFVAGTVFGWIIVKISRPPDHLRGLILGCCAAGNLGNIPIIIIPAMCREKGSPFGDVDACRMHGLAYASLSMAIGAIYLWIYVYNLIRIYSTKTSMKAELELPSSSVEEQIADRLPLQDRQDKIEVPTKLGKVKQWLHTKLKNLNVRRVLAPSTIAAVIGFIIGMVPFLREMMIGDAAPLRIIENSVSILGEASIATITLILGANLLEGLKGSNIQFSAVAGVIAVKYLALPLLGIVVVEGATRLKLVPHDPLYRFFLLLQFAVPPAMNIGTITQLFGVGEKECSVIMLWSNGLASVTLTVWSAFFMWLVS